MKTAVKFFVAFLIWGVSPAVQAINSLPLTEVDLYLQGAKLLHRGKVNVQSGTQTIQISGLASDINERSLQLSLSTEIQLLKFQIVKQPLRNASRPKPLAGMLDSLQDLQQALELHRANREVFVQEQQMILANKQIGGQNGVSVLELQKMSDFFRVRLHELNIKLAQAKAEETKLLAQYHALKSRLDEQRALLPDFEVLLELDVKAEKPGKYEMSLAYLIDAAYWEPSYEIRATGMGAPVDVYVKAQITQRSGLDWKDIAMRISTQLPQQISAKPVISPWILDFYDPKPVAMYDQDVRAGMAPRMHAEAVDGSAKNLAKANYTPKQQFLNLIYEPKQRLTVPHALSQLVALDQHQFRADYQHYLAPRISKEVYLLVAIAGFDSLRFMPGNASVFFENTLINQAWMEFESENDTLELALGIDKAVKVDFTESTFNEQKRLGQQQAKRYVYSIRVNNSHQQAVHLKIQDQIPVSRQKEITVEDAQLNHAMHDAATGLLTWHAKIQAGTTIQIEYGFEVRYPKNKRVLNL